MSQPSWSARTTSAAWGGLVALLVLAGGCSDDEPGTAHSSAFCETYAEHRDGPAAEAVAAAAELEDVGLADELDDQAAGFKVYLAFLRDSGDGEDEGLFDDQYATLIGDPELGQVTAFLDAADETCGVGSTSDAPTDATKAAYCDAIGDISSDQYDGALPFAGTEADDVAELAAVGTPARLGRAGTGADFRAAARRGFVAYTERFASLSDAQRDELSRLEDDAFRTAFGVTDAFYLDAWVGTTFAICFPGYE